jgi:cell division protein FtsW (lipid II flippase)
MSYGVIQEWIGMGSSNIQPLEAAFISNTLILSENITYHQRL